MHQLFKLVLGQKDLSRAGDLFSLEDSEIEDSLTEALEQIKIISSSSRAQGGLMLTFLVVLRDWSHFKGQDHLASPPILSAQQLSPTLGTNMYQAKERDWT
ncbi:hypothetical protein FD755_014678 [Muntiacus reevesi]|uniref:Uncharacterized protein n=2 Tax=Muntiacus TaxID=9885 RepID=A0A5N3XKB0_MUNRE|nr:hypothetical protein FD754_000964 [Muntiacus muntjak]KAB0374422.1 hypothetical protein FD755_014678 [Muntiacus reevesi]